MRAASFFFAVVAVAVAGCQPTTVFEGEGEGEGFFGGVATGTKDVTLRLAPDADAQRFDVDVDNDGFAFEAVVEVFVSRSTAPLFLSVNSDPAFVDDGDNYALVDVGSVVSAALVVDGDGRVGGFALGAAAADVDTRVDLGVLVNASVDVQDSSLSLGRLVPRP